MSKNVLIIPDLHCPIQHPDALQFLTELKAELKPDLIVSVGDEVDMHNHAKWLREPDAPGICDELDNAIEELRPFYKLFPEMKVCTSNHTFRYLKRAHEAGLAPKMVKHIRDILEAPKGWDWADQWIIDGVMYSHGENAQDLLRALKHYRMNLVVGHNHSKASIVYSNNGLQTNFAINTGCLINTEAYGMRYAKHHPDQPVLGAGAIIDGSPFWFPLK